MVNHDDVGRTVQTADGKRGHLAQVSTPTVGEDRAVVWLEEGGDVCLPCDEVELVEIG